MIIPLQNVVIQNRIKIKIKIRINNKAIKSHQNKLFFYFYNKYWYQSIFGVLNNLRDQFIKKVIYGRVEL